MTKRQRYAPLPFVYQSSFLFGSLVTGKAAASSTMDVMSFRVLTRHSEVRLTLFQRFLTLFFFCANKRRRAASDFPLPVYDFLHHVLVCPVSDAVHLPHPCRRVAGFRLCRRQRRPALDIAAKSCYGSDMTAARGAGAPGGRDTAKTAQGA